jgi:hypothetical protein
MWAVARNRSRAPEGVARARDRPDPGVRGPPWEHLVSYEATCTLPALGFIGATVLLQQGKLSTNRFSDQEALRAMGVAEIAPWLAGSPPPAGRLRKTFYQVVVCRERQGPWRFRVARLCSRDRHEKELVS